MIGKIHRVPLQEVFKHEAFDFTRWLEKNVDVLNDALNLSLSGAERERAAGDFSVDLVAEDEDGSPVVIENQLKKSDHDHLGKLLTYLVAVGAKTAVWIVSEPRNEHVRAVSWLNESSSADFYLVKIEAIKIAESPPAPLLTQVVGPSAESREVGEAKKEWAERETLRYRFWEELLERSRSKTQIHTYISPTRGGWVGAGAGKAGLSYVYSITEHATKTELSIDRGSERADENKTIFETLKANREQIEEVFDGELVWDYVEGRSVCRVAKLIPSGGYRDEERWPEIHDEMIDAMIRLEKALRPYIEKLGV